jgi:hypothetical protein
VARLRSRDRPDSSPAVTGKLVGCGSCFKLPMGRGGLDLHSHPQTVSYANHMTSGPQPRCTFRGCPVRYTAGDNRPCPDHSEDTVRDTIRARAAELGVMMETAPGEHASEASR